jgi:hypothetical protein
MQHLYNTIRKCYIILVSLIVLAFAGCSKGGSTPTPNPPPVVVAESDIVFKVDIAGSEVNYASVYAVVGTSVIMNPTISSTLPKDGVTIDVSVKKKLDNTVVFSSNVSSSASSNPVTVTGLVPGVLCVATITITSKSKATNTATKTFDLAAK